MIVCCMRHFHIESAIAMMKRSTKRRDTFYGIQLDQGRSNRHITYHMIVCHMRHFHNGNAIITIKGSTRKRDTLYML